MIPYLSRPEIFGDVRKDLFLDGPSVSNYPMLPMGIQIDGFCYSVFCRLQEIHQRIREISDLPMRPSISTTSISGENTGGELTCIVPNLIFDSEYDENGCFANFQTQGNQVPGVIEIGLPDQLFEHGRYTMAYQLLRRTQS